ncbi:Phosphatidylinositol transfer protein beta isoform-like protein [Camelus ferus]|nr:Phosphatidylinositol transfer protein beta isoform-like protein [Camelus ferus]
MFCSGEASKNETGGGEGIEVLKNEPYEKDGEKGQYTHKIYHLKSKVPAFVRMIAPEGSLVFHEKAWNAYPYCRTIVTNEYMKDDFFIKIETWHKPDLGTLENVHGLDPNMWKTVEIVHIDIADRSQVEPADYKADEDPALFQSVKTKRGPLGPNWKKELANNPDCPQMCAYKLVTIKFKWWGLQSKVENFIQKGLRKENRTPGAFRTSWILGWEGFIGDWGQPGPALAQGHQAEMQPLRLLRPESEYRSVVCRLRICFDFSAYDIFINTSSRLSPDSKYPAAHGSRSSAVPSWGLPGNLARWYGQARTSPPIWVLG